MGKKSKAETKPLVIDPNEPTNVLLNDYIRCLSLMIELVDAEALDDYIQSVHEQIISGLDYLNKQHPHDQRVLRLFDAYYHQNRVVIRGIDTAIVHRGTNVSVVVLNDI